MLLPLDVAMVTEGLESGLDALAIAGTIRAGTLSRSTIAGMHPFKDFALTLRRLMADEAFRAGAAILLALMSVGTVFYMVVEGWSLLDSLYFAVITAATVGFGDFAPQTDLGKLFTIIYVLIGVGLLVMLLSRVASGMVDRRLEDTARKGPRQRRRVRRRTSGPEPGEG